MPVFHFAQPLEQLRCDRNTAQVVVGAVGVAQIRADHDFLLGFARQVIFTDTQCTFVQLGIDMHFIGAGLPVLDRVLRRAKAPVITIIGLPEGNGIRQIRMR